MRVLVVYDTVYGNTRAIAQSIGAALPGEVQVLAVSQVAAGDLEAADLLVLGSPTQGALPTKAVQGLLDKVGPPAREGARAATFDTRLTWKFLERWGGLIDGKQAEGKGLGPHRGTGRVFRQGPQERAAQARGSGARRRLGKRACREPNSMI